jgi:hypothetical protein
MQNQDRGGETRKAPARAAGSGSEHVVTQLRHSSVCRLVPGSSAPGLAWGESGHPRPLLVRDQVMRSQNV